ncbi:MAG TPA: 50S ribosomal protein L21e [archaeon]|nr:50S ribosomal protein L21e [archaeon]
MVRFGHGFRHGSRYKLRKEPRSKFTVEPFLASFAQGERVAVDIYPASQKGMPHPRMQGLVGTVTERRGDAYVIAVPVGRKVKTVIARPEHLHRIKSDAGRKALPPAGGQLRRLRPGAPSAAVGAAGAHVSAG